MNENKMPLEEFIHSLSNQLTIIHCKTKKLSGMKIPNVDPEIRKIDEACEAAISNLKNFKTFLKSVNSQVG